MKDLFYILLYIIFIISCKVNQPIIDKVSSEGNVDSFDRSQRNDVNEDFKYKKELFTAEYR